MRIYLAAQFGRREELLEYATELRAAGHEVTSRWLAMHDNPPLAAEIELAADSIDPEAATFAISDRTDVFRSEALIAFTEPLGGRPFAGRGGRHVEIGWAQEWGKKIVAVGGVENPAHVLPGVVHVSAWNVGEVRAALAAAPGVTGRFKLGAPDPDPDTVFLAGATARNHELAELSEALAAAGRSVLAPPPHGTGATDTATRSWHAVHRGATLVALSEAPAAHRGADRGLRHVTFGWAQAAGRRLIVLGPRENIMHALPGVEHVAEASAAALITALAQPAPSPGTLGRAARAAERARLARQGA